MHFGINVDQIDVLWSFVSIFLNALLLKMSSQEFVSEKLILTTFLKVCGCLEIRLIAFFKSFS